MRTNEAYILALVATGMLMVDPMGRIVRHRTLTLGREQDCQPTPVDTGRSEKGGYRRVQVTIDSKRYKAPAHRIVWMVSNQRLIPAGFEPNHINGIKDDNRPGNLELRTRSGNVLHALHDLGQYKKSRNGKLTPEQVVEIRHLRDNKIATRALVAEQFGVSTVMVKKIERRESWKWVPEFPG